MRDRSIWGVHDHQGTGTDYPSGCGVYRVTMPFDQLAKHGWNAQYGIGLPDYDPGLIVGQRVDNPLIRPVWDSMKANGFPLVYEIDDDPFSVDEVNWLAFPAFSRPEVLDFMRYCASTADLVTASTEPLAQIFREFNPNVTVIPNCIPAAMLTAKQPRHEKLTIGWAGGASHSRDIAMIAQSWRDVLDETGARGHFVGVEYLNLMRRRSFDYTPWVTTVAAYYRALDFDIGLAPIAPHPFGDSKSNLKCLEYAALGIPVVASDCLAYRDFVIDGVTGFLCSTQKQWRDAMLLLAHDSELREKMGALARERARAFTIEEHWVRWEQAYAPLLEET